MRFLFFVCLFLLGSLNVLYSKDKEQVTDGSDDSKKTEKKDQLLNLFLEYPKVKPIFETCMKQQKDKTLKTSIADCIWDKVDSETKNELKNAISSAEFKKDSSRKPTSSDDPIENDKDKEKKGEDKATSKKDEGRNYEGVYLGTVTPYKGDKALLKVEEFLVKRLEESLVGVDPKVAKVVDHQKFHSLYRSQVGKNILHALSGYCVEAKMFENPKLGFIPSTFIIEESDKKIQENRKTNISLLTNFDKDGENEVYKVWQSCVKNIKSICYLEKGMNGIDYGNKEILVENSYSHNRACQVTHYIRENRQNLIATKEIQEQMFEFTKANSNVFFESNVKYYEYGKGDKEENLSELTNLSSREFYDAYKVKAKEVSDEFDKKCLEAKDKEECKKHLIIGKDKEDVTKELAEFELKRKVMDEKIKNIRSPAEIKQYLREEGYKEDEIDLMIGDSTDEQVIRDAIEKHYAKEKNSLIAAINKQLEKSSSKNDEISFEAGNATTSDMDLLKGISADLKSNGTRYQEMMHFSNIISSFLEIKVDEQKESSRNTASLFRELEHEKNKQIDRVPADDSMENGSTNLVDADDMENKAKAAGVKETIEKDDDQTKISGESTLEVEVINEHFLNYGKKKKASPK